MLNQLIQIISTLLLPLGHTSSFQNGDFNVLTNTFTIDFNLSFNLECFDEDIANLLLINDISSCHIHLEQVFSHEPILSILLLPVEANDLSIITSVNDIFCPVALYLKSLIACYLSDFSTWQPTITIGKGGDLYDNH